jgi:hypothetical protein
MPTPRWVPLITDFGFSSVAYRAITDRTHASCNVPLWSDDEDEDDADAGSAPPADVEPAPAPATSFCTVTLGTGTFRPGHAILYDMRRFIGSTVAQMQDAIVKGATIVPGRLAVELAMLSNDVGAIGRSGIGGRGVLPTLIGMRPEFFEPFNVAAAVPQGAEGPAPQLPKPGVDAVAPFHTQRIEASRFK